MSEDYDDILDRLDYLSPMANNYAFVASVEKLLGVETTERCRFLLFLRDRKGSVEAATQRTIAAQSDELTKSITWGPGKEMARHAESKSATNIPGHSCDPHSPRQRGTNENTNGMPGDGSIEPVSPRRGADSAEPQRTPT